MNLQYKDQQAFQSQPRLRIIMAIILLCSIIIWSAFYFYNNENQSLELVQFSIFLAGIIISFLLFTTLFTLELYHFKKITQKKLIHQLKLKDRKQKKLEEKLAFILNHDLTTALPNRNAIEHHLTQIITTQKHCTIFSISLNNIHFISDTYGYEIVEKLFSQLVIRFQHVLDKSTVLARVEFDKIMMLCPHLSLLNAEIVASQLNSSLTEEFNIQEQEISLHCSIGIACNKDNNSSKTLIHQADMALRRAKTQAQKQIVTYHPHIQKELEQKRKTERALKYAINNNELRLNFQPQVDLRSNKIVGIEALIRWRDRNNNTILQPNLLIQTAEKSGLILQLGHWVMESALKQYSILLDERCAPNLLTINISGLEFKDNNFVEYINNILNYYDIPGSRVQLELSEKVFIGNIDNIINTLHHLSKLGINLAINDFGTGYLSLYFLKQLPINTLKIDPRFISNVSKSKDDMAICKTIITMANLLQIKTVSVGVENQRQQIMLQNIGCHFVQGCHLYQPMPLEKLLALLKEKRSHKLNA